VREGMPDWLVNPYSFDQAVKAVNVLLEALRPPGEIKLPPQAFEKAPPGCPPEGEPFEIYSRIGERNATFLLCDAATGIPSSSYHARVIHEMLGTLVNRIKQFAPPGEPEDRK
jgi:hypothetical protein